MSLRRSLASALAAPLLLLLFFAGPQARATIFDVTDGSTSVLLTSAPAFGSLNVAVTPILPAALAALPGFLPTAAFPVTGGSLDLPSFAGTVEHRGGLSLSAGGTTVNLTDFLIDTSTSLLSGAVTVNGISLGNVALFDIDVLSAAQIVTPAAVSVISKLTLTAGAATALESAFQLPSGALTGFEVGLGSTFATVVPEPSTYAMLGLGLLALGAMKLRRRQALT